MSNLIIPPMPIYQLDDACRVIRKKNIISSTSTKCSEPVGIVDWEKFLAVNGDGGSSFKENE